MITGTVWGITLLIAGLIATIAATQVLFGALFPTGMAATRRALRAWPVASVLAGLAALAVLVLVLILLTMGLQKIGLEVVGAVLIATVSLFLLFGLGAVASEVGERLPSGAAAASGWRATIRGSVALSLASLLPVAGWFLIFPMTWAAGLGGMILAACGAGAEARAAVATVRTDAPPPAPVSAPEPAEVTA